jgi:hypothetical protein
VERKRRTTTAVLVASAAAVLALGAAASAQTAAAPGPSGVATPLKVVARGLDNPRGLAFGPNGALYVAESGQGGQGPCGRSAEGSRVCYGKSGAVTRLKNGPQKRLIRGLPSLAGKDGSAATGPSDVSVQGKAGSLNLSVTVGGFGGKSKGARGISGDKRFQSILRAKGGKVERVADLLAYELRNNPDDQPIDSNPNSLISSGGKHVVADAGANDLLEAKGDAISTLAVFANRKVKGPDGKPVSMQSVPDAVAKAPGGGYYVGELTGFPFPVGGARVYHVAQGGKPKVYAKGFTNIVDVTVGPKGGLYVLEIARKGLLQAFGPSGDFTGRLVHISPDRKRKVVASKGLVAPTGVAVGPKGGIYVSNFGIFPNQGQVVRVRH